MNFSFLSLPWVVGGLAVLAGALHLLQRLRIRHRQRVVPTTLFWRAAAEESPARTFRERFRHPWAYLLFLAIASLLWLAFAGLELRRDADDTFHILVLDGSAGMSAGSRYGDAVAALQDRVRDLPAARRQVLWNGGETRTLLNPGEHSLLLGRRLAHLTPVAAPAGIEQLLRTLAATSRPGLPTQVTVFGDAPIRDSVLALAPELKVARAASNHERVHNLGITALGVAEAASGTWNRVDVFMRVDGDTGAGDDAVPLASIDGTDVPAGNLQPVPGDSKSAFVVRDVPARGGLFSVRLNAEDDIAADNVARIRLPDRPLLRVQLSPSLDAALRPVLEVDAAVELVEEGAAVVVRRANESVGEDLPALVFAPATDRAAFVITHPDVLSSADVLTHAVEAIGLREIDAMSLASSAQREIGVTISEGPQWKFEVWEELLTEDFNFVSSRSFPLFMANSLRWLGQLRPGHAVAAAGQPLVAESLAAGARILSGDGRVIDPLGVAFVPTQAGELQREGGANSVSVSLLDPITTIGLPDTASSGSAPDALRRTFGSPITWLLLGAFLLLGVEWYLLQSGRVP